MVKNPPTVQVSPGLERASGEGNDNPLQYSCLGNPWTEEPRGLQSTELQKLDRT